jgi:enoyl-CoA hydratase
MMLFKDVIVEREDRKLLVKINRPEVLNALREDTFLELEQALKEFSGADEYLAMIITGVGDRAFSAGGDIKALNNMNSGDAASFAAMTHRVLDRLESVPKPVVAAVNGYALGAGCDLATACDVVVASEKARFGEPPAGLGITTPFGGTQRLPRIIGPKRAKRLFFTGETIDAEEALRFGLVNKVVKHEELLSETMKLVDKMLELAPIAVGFFKQLVNFSSYGSLGEGDKLEQELFARCFETEDRNEGTAAFLEKRKPIFKGR